MIFSTSDSHDLQFDQFIKLSVSLFHLHFIAQEALILMNKNWCAGRRSIRLALFLNRYFDQIAFIFDRTLFGFGDSKIWYEMIVKFAMVTMSMINYTIRKTFT